MFVVAHHDITDPRAFWKVKETFPESIPPGHKLLAVYPSLDGRRATCLWESEDEPALREFVDEISSGLSRNEYMAVDEDNAIGLPRPRYVEERPPII